MVRNYFKVAFRNLWKHKSFSAINIVGLAIGIAACLFILQYVSFKLSYDQFHKNSENIYRVVNDRFQNGELIQHGTITYSAVGRAMNEYFDDVVLNTRVMPSGENVIVYGDKKLIENSGLFVENSFFSLFSFDLLAGDRITFLKAPYTVVISEKLARNIFDYKGNDFNILVGKSIVLGSDSMPYKVEGICRNVPENSHLSFDLLISYPTIVKFWEEADHSFKASDFWHYVELRPGADHRALNKKMQAFSDKYFKGNTVSGSEEKFFLQPLAKAHLYSDFEYEIGETASASVVWSLLTISLFIIGIAWVNYINLSTARSVERAKEVGIRKVVGGERKQLITQFMLEAGIVNILAIILAIVLIMFFQERFNNLLEYNLSMSYLLTKGLNGYSIFIGLVAIVFAGIFVSGFYPAFVLSAFRPVTILKGKYSRSKKGIVLRKMLVIGQFTVTVALLIGSFVVARQIKFMSTKELGFNMDQVMIIRGPLLTQWDTTFIGRTNALKEELKQLPAVLGAATSWNVPGGDIGRSFNVRQADSASTNRFTVRHTGVDYNFFDVLSIKMVAGRKYTTADHDPNFGKLKNIIINRAAAKLLGFKSPEAAIGKSILRGDKKWDVIGVVENYHQKALKHPLEPMIFFPAYSSNSEIFVKLKTKDVSGSISSIRDKYQALFPGNVFDYYFLDERYNRQYKQEQLFGKVFTIFSALAIFVACIGLFGLAMFSTIQRTKEIGIRKVLGASVQNILVLVSKDFMLLVTISAVIAFPLAGWAMNRWLQDFAFRINLEWWVFAVAACIAMAVAIITITLQAIRAALSNPVNSLRSE